MYAFLTVLNSNLCSSCKREEVVSIDVCVIMHDSMDMIKVTKRIDLYFFLSCIGTQCPCPPALTWIENRRANPQHENVEVWDDGPILYQLFLGTLFEAMWVFEIHQTFELLLNGPPPLEIDRAG